MALDERNLLAWSEARYLDNETLTCCDPTYPARWRRSFKTPPLALWRRSEIPLGPFRGVVGTRQPNSMQHWLAVRTTEEANRRAIPVVSGGAPGIDTVARQSAAQGVAILPCGLQHAKIDGPIISACAPWEEFTTIAAMERNALIYAASIQTIAIGARFGFGGTWHGAAQALRKRLCDVWIPADGSPAANALISLGATPLDVGAFQKSAPATISLLSR